MLINLLFAVFCILAVIGCVYCYCLGVKHGRVVTSGGNPHMPNPVKAVAAAFEAHKDKKEAEEAEDELEQYLSFSQDTILQAIKADKGRG